MKKKIVQYMGGTKFLPLLAHVLRYTVHSSTASLTIPPSYGPVWLIPSLARRLRGEMKNNKIDEIDEIDENDDDDDDDDEEEEEESDHVHFLMPRISHGFSMLPWGAKGTLRGAFAQGKPGSFRTGRSPCNGPVMGMFCNTKHAEWETPDDN